MEPQPEDRQTCSCSTPVSPGQAKRPSDYTIDHILHRAGHRSPPYDWLLCSRYRPPKLHRLKKVNSGQLPQRKLGRNPRIPFSAAQIAVLEEKFRNNPYLSFEDLRHLSTLLRLSDTRVKIWFQNRRARERRENGMVDVVNQTTSRSTSSEHMKSAFTPTTASLHPQQEAKSAPQS